MTRKRFVKLGMAEGMGRNEAIFAAKHALNRYGSYEKAYNQLYHTIRGMYEFYMPGHEKRIANKNKKYFGY